MSFRGRTDQSFCNMMKWSTQCKALVLTLLAVLQFLTSKRAIQSYWKATEYSLMDLSLSLSVADLFLDDIPPPPPPEDYPSLLVNISHPIKEEFQQFPWAQPIFEKAIPVDIRYVDVASNTTQFTAHLHMGALDENGNAPFVYDVTSLTRNPPPFNISDWMKTCDWKDEHNLGLQNVLKLPSVPPNITHKQRPIRLLCAIYSVEQYHADRIPILRETWAPKCDGFFVASNKTDPRYDAVQILKRGEESYNNMWAKTQAIWGYIYDNYFEQYDWYLLGGDDMWVIVENLRYYLNSDEIYLAQTGGRPEGLPRGLQIPLYLGEPVVMNGKGPIYNTGGPGYLLNKAALKMLITEALPAATRVAGRTTSAEDEKMAITFQQYGPNPVMPYPTRDTTNRNRFNTFAPARLYANMIPHWYKKFGASFIGTFGRDGFSNESVSFHYMNKEELRRAHVFRYLCPQATTTPLATSALQIDAPPQVLNLGRFKDQSAYPYISTDVWQELVDNNTTFFLRPQDFAGNLSTEEYWLDWLDAVPWPVTFLMNNNVDWSFPHPRIPLTSRTLDHPNLKRLYVMNPVILHPKIMPLSIGYKWQYRSTALYGESKEPLLVMYRNVSTSAEMTRSLFASHARTETVWVRPATGRGQAQYEKTNAALQTPRPQICEILQGTAPRATVCATDKVSREEYFDQLLHHRFVISAAGVGLDTHTTWEALLAGCIPIVPRSPLSAIYDLLPVWQVDRWEEVTDEAVAQKSQEFLAKNQVLRWDLAFATGWETLLRET